VTTPACSYCTTASLRRIGQARYPNRDSYYKLRGSFSCRLYRGPRPVQAGVYEQQPGSPCCSTYPGASDASNFAVLRLVSQLAEAWG
jgi:hypothetical protein